MIAIAGNEPRSVFDAIVANYVDQARALTYAQLRERQDPPFASLAFGAAGLSYFFWRAARARGDESLLDDAARWIDAAQQPEALAFRPDEEPEHGVTDSLHYGPDGVLFAQILVGHARGQVEDDARTAFARRCRELADAPSELLFGAAGYLSAACTLFAETQDARFYSAATDVAVLLLKQRSRWEGMTNIALAHGRAGILYSLVRWQKMIAAHGNTPQAAVSALIAAALERLADAEAGLRRKAAVVRLPDAKRSAHEMTFARSWCNGAAGMALLWAEAQSWKPNANYQERARAAGRFLLAGSRSSAEDLCCGHAGRAYALLSLAAIDRSQDWRMSAVRAARCTTLNVGPWPNSVLKGYPGLCILAWELNAKKPGGFPLLGG